MRKIDILTPDPQGARARLDALECAGVDTSILSTEKLETLTVLVGASPAAAGWVSTDPAIIDVLEITDAPMSVSDFDQRLSYLRNVSSRFDFMRELRLEARKQFARIIVREATGVSVEVTGLELANFAESALTLCMDRSLAEADGRHGRPVGRDGRRAELFSIGMGKLGGRELNPSSDVDLIFFHTGAPLDTCSDELIANEFFSRVVRETSALIGEPTAEGLVFRVDLGLRPYGVSGETAPSAEQGLAYYFNWGRPWERTAMTRARAVSGDIAAGERFLVELTPFIYSRNLDFTTVEDIRRIKRELRGAPASGSGFNLKTGRGGIREAEFFVQTLILINGGRHPGVRAANSWEGLDNLIREGLVDREKEAQLGDSLRLLRRAEHATQTIDFKRTHLLPPDGRNRLVIAHKCGFEDLESFDAAIAEAREKISCCFDSIFHAGLEDTGAKEPAAAIVKLAAGTLGDSAALKTLSQLGFSDPRGAFYSVDLLRSGAAGRRGEPAHVSKRANRIFARLLPRLIELACDSPNPDRALRLTEEFINSTKARAGYLALLEENPGTAKAFVKLFGTSGYLARYMIGRPELLDELVVMDRHGKTETGELTGKLAAELARAEDDEARWDGVRRLRNREFLSIALADVAGLAEHEEVSERISDVAEVCIGALTKVHLDELVYRFGEPLNSAGLRVGFSIFGLGKLGGRELDYHSDLDLLFVYSAQGNTSHGMDNGEFFAKLARKILTALSARTGEGVAFPIDARLRPSGSSGPLVSSFESFGQYHSTLSKLWEKQALLKLRWICGDAVLGTRVGSVVEKTLFAGPPPEGLTSDIRQMRQRLIKASEKAGGQDLKAGRGGLQDVEFATQAIQLLFGHQHEQLRTPNTLQALSAAAKLGIPGSDLLTTIEKQYRTLKRVESRLRIIEERATDRLPTDKSKLAELGKAAGFPPDKTLENIDRTRHNIAVGVERVFEMLAYIRQSSPA